MREAIASGEIGSPTGAIFFGASSLMHGHIHTIDTLSYLLGDPGIARVRGELLEVPPADMSLADGGHVSRQHSRINQAPDCLGYLQMTDCLC